jgi:hypothetical protein
MLSPIPRVRMWFFQNQRLSMVEPGTVFSPVSQAGAVSSVNPKQARELKRIASNVLDMASDQDNEGLGLAALLESCMKNLFHLR